MENKKKKNQFSGMTREEIIQESRKQIMHSTVLALVALIVIGVAAYAWFANNKSVTANLSAVSLNADCFELASVGKAGVFDGKIPENYMVSNGESWNNSEGKSGTYTAGKQAILWQMNADSNMNNQASTGALPAGNGIAPGSYGQLTFYVIPKINGNLKLTFHIEVIPLKQGNGGLQELESIDPAWNLIQGHLLFSIPGESGEMSVDFKNKSFERNFGTVTKDGTPIPVTLNWYWPYVLSDAGEDAAGWMKQAENAAFFFYDPSATGTNVVNISGATEKKLNDWFNNADQKIGEEIDAIILQLSAVME